MKIGIVYPSFYGIGGIARYLESFLENLPDGCEQIYVITSSNGYIEKNIPNVKFIHVNSPDNRFGLITWAIRVRALLKKMYENKELEHINFHFPPMLAGLLLPSNIPQTLTVHSTYLGMSGKISGQRYFEGEWNSISLYIKVLMERWLLRKSNQVITLNEKGVEELEYYGYKKSVHIVPNGVDIEQFRPKPNANKKYDVIFCGRIEKMKGSRALVEVCELLIKLEPSIRICVVGYGGDAPYVQNHLASYDQVILVGKIPFEQVSSFYDKSRIYASTSFYEGLPGTCLEAMASGIPAVGWNLPFYKGVIVDGVNGALVKVNETEAFAKQLLTILSESATEKVMCEKARLHIESGYNWQKLSKSMLKAYSSIK